METVSAPYPYIVIRTCYAGQHMWAIIVRLFLAGWLADVASRRRSESRLRQFRVTTQPHHRAAPPPQLPAAAEGLGRPVHLRRIFRRRLLLAWWTHRTRG